MTSDRTTALILSVAALVAAVALLIYALGNAGVIGSGRGDNSTGSTPDDALVADTATPVAAAAIGSSAATDQADSEGAEAGDAATLAAPVSPVAGSGTATGPTRDSRSSPAPGGPTARLSPTPGPSPTVEPGSSRVVESWVRLEERDFDDAIAENEGWADNEINVNLIDSSDAPGDGAGIALEYDILAAAPNDYVGFELNLDELQDWRGYTHLSLPLRTTDVSARQLVVQWYERSGEVWRHRTTLGSVSSSGLLEIPLRPEEWEWADWSEYRDLEMDLDSVGRLGIFVGHVGPGSGLVEIGEVRVVHTE